LKLDAPCFNGIDPHGWIFKISQLFDYHATAKEERIMVAFSLPLWSSIVLISVYVSQCPNSLMATILIGSRDVVCFDGV